MLKSINCEYYDVENKTCDIDLVNIITGHENSPEGFKCPFMDSKSAQICKDFKEYIHPIREIQCNGTRIMGPFPTEYGANIEAKKLHNVEVVEIKGDNKDDSLRPMS